MKKIIRMVTGVVLTLVGLGAAGFCVYYAFKGGPIWAAIGGAVGGLVLALSGIRLITGDKLQDIIGDFFLSN